MKLQTVEKFAQKQNISVAEASKLIKEAQLPIIDGFFDQDRFDAYSAMPHEYAKKPLEWGLATTHGLGAIKACVDPSDVRIAAHYLQKANYLDLVNAAGKIQHVKLYYTNSTSQASTSALFSFTNFVEDSTGPTHFVCCAFRIPALWVISRAQLQQAWVQLSKSIKNKGVTVDYKGALFRIPASAWRADNGKMKVRFSTTNSAYAFDAKRLGL